MPFNLAERPAKKLTTTNTDASGADLLESGLKSFLQAVRRVKNPFYYLKVVTKFHKKRQKTNKTRHIRRIVSRKDDELRQQIHIRRIVSRKGLGEKTNTYSKNCSKKRRKGEIPAKEKKYREKKRTHFTALNLQMLKVSGFVNVTKCGFLLAERPAKTLTTTNIDASGADLLESGLKSFFAGRSACHDSILLP